jgi:tetratricopeptide (TPR) repeat protein
MCHALPASAAEKWTRVESKNFTLVGNASENEIREVAEGLEVFRTVFSRFFKMKEGSSVATTVVVFRSDQAFKSFKPLYQGKPANIAGYFQPGPDMNLIVLAADMETPRVIYHEYVHRLMSDNLAALPPWFQEGFAECFSTMEIEGKDKKVRMGRAIAEHVALLNERRFMPLEQLFAVEHGSREYNEEEKQGLFYAESWALVHYMMFDSDQRRAQFNSFLADIGRGIPAPRAFEEAFGIELSGFQRTFEAYIQQRMAWNAFEIKTPEGLGRSKEMTARPLSEGQAEFYLGDLLLRQDRLPEAEAHLTKAIQLEPKFGRAHASMGRLATRKKNNAEALTYMKRAAELDPDNYLMHYYYAGLLRSQEGTLSDSDRDIVRRELQRTVELAPQFVEATEMLASENLSRNMDIAQTVELLAKAVVAAPGRDYLVLQLAMALSRTQQRNTARPIVQNLLGRPGLQAPLRQNAQSLLDYLNRVDAAESANRAIAEAMTRRTPPGNRTEVDPEPPDVRTPETPPELREPPPERIRRDTLPPGTQRIRGILTLLDCRDGVTLSLVVDGKTAKLHSATPSQIKFTSFNASVNGTIACGPAPGTGVPAEIIYRPGDSRDSIGDPVAVDFLESLDPAATRRVPLPRIAGTTTVTGVLTMLDCSRGVTVTLVSEGKTLRFHTASTTSVAFLNGPNPDGTVTCGPMPGNGLPVVVLYRPVESTDFLGEPIVVQFQSDTQNVR